MTVIKQGNKFPYQTNTKSINFHTYVEMLRMLDFSFEYIGENFLIKLDNFYVTEDLKLVTEIEEASHFYVKDNNLMVSNKIIVENVYFVEYTSSPLIEAIRMNKPLKEIIESNLFEQYGRQNYVNKHGDTAFMYACGFNHKNVYEYMIKNNYINSSNINIQNNYGVSAFIYLCEEDNLNTIKYLIELNLINSSNINIKDNKGKTGFMYLCSNGSIDTIKYLIESDLINSSNINIKDNKGKIAFIYAYENNKQEVIDYLLEKFPFEDISEIFEMLL